VTEQTRFLTFAVSTAIVIGVIAFVLWYR